MQKSETFWTEELLTADEAILLLPWIAEFIFAFASEKGMFPKPVECSDRVRRWKVGNLLAWSAPDSDGAFFINGVDQQSILKLVRTSARHPEITRALRLLFEKKVISQNDLIEELRLCGLPMK